MYSKSEGVLPSGMSEPSIITLVKPMSMADLQVSGESRVDITLGIMPLQAIMVTATLREEEVADVPFSIAAPTAQMLRSRGAENIDPTRQTKSPFWPVEEGIARGYAMAAFLNADVDPDKHDGFKDGIHGILDDGPRGPDAWGASKIAMHD